MNDLTAAKLKMMKASIRCLVFGLFGLLPVVGLPFAAAALVSSGQARLREKRFWNPAKPYRLIGVVCAALGTIFWFIVLSLIIYNNVSNHSGYYGSNRFDE
jgi:hypothetical protein